MRSFSLEPEGRFRPVRFSDITVIMKKQTVISKKKRGPAPTGKGEPQLVRMQPDQINAIDRWRASQEDDPSRPEAIRRLVDVGLKAKAPK